MSKTYIPVAVRKQVYERAKSCCEYCLIPDIATFAAHEVDRHFPYSNKSNRALDESNNLVKPNL